MDGGAGDKRKGQGLVVGVRDLRGFGSLNSSHRQQRPHRGLLGSNLSLLAAVGEVDTKMDPTASLSWLCHQVPSYGEGCSSETRACVLGAAVSVSRSWGVTGEGWAGLRLKAHPSPSTPVSCPSAQRSRAEVTLWPLFPTPPSGWDTSFLGPFSLPLIYNPSR